jgi:hypothetical protein
MTVIKAYAIPTTGGAAAEWQMATTSYQVVAIGGSLLLGCKPHNGEWSTTYITDPDRFGEFNTPRQIKAWVEKFLGDADAEG